jgi:BirA family biotin operon repressor/biotin-[acetyl-CoA-carboxylase] ligase
MSQDPLVACLELLADGAPHRKEELPSSGGLLEQLAAYGVVEAEGSLVLPGGLELLDVSLIRSRLEPPVQDFVSRIEVFGAIDSTNAHLLDAATSDAIEGRVCLAEMQTSGRGRRGRSWASPFASSIYLSLGIRVDVIPAIQALSLVVGVAVADALSDLGAVGVGLKWPNDVLWRERKLAGILLELARPSGADAAVVIGIGVNVRVPQHVARDIDQPWADLEGIVGSRVSRNILAATLLNRLGGTIERFRREGFTPFKDRWEALHVHRGALVETHMADTRVTGIAVGVDHQGQLLVNTGDAVVALVGGEVSIRRPSGP